MRIKSAQRRPQIQVGYDNWIFQPSSIKSQVLISPTHKVLFYSLEYDVFAINGVPYRQFTLYSAFVVCRFIARQ